jgi:two-component system, sporulation sensor kinase E
MPKELPKQEELFFELFKKSANGVFVSDQNFRIYDVDEMFTKTFLSGKPLSDSISLCQIFKNDSDCNEVINTLKQKKRFKTTEIELQTRTGKSMYCELSMVKHRDKISESTVYLGLIYDISARKAAERNLLQAEKMVAAGKLSRILAHEIRNPLTNVQLALEQLKDEFSEQAEEADLYFDVIERNTKRIGNLISELLNSSRPKVLNLTLKPVNSVIEAALQLVADRITLKEIDLNLNLDKRNPTLNLDVEHLKLALVNIMVNAIEAMKEGKGKLTITSKMRKDVVDIIIKDNGHGLTEEEINMLFEPFYSKKRNGSGLGLTTVQNIIHGHKGVINVKSTPGKQTQFTISLPL